MSRGAPNGNVTPLALPSSNGRVQKNRPNDKYVHETGSVMRSNVGWIVVYKIPYRRAPRLAYRLHRPSASREQRYLAYKLDRPTEFQSEQLSTSIIIYLLVSF